MEEIFWRAVWAVVPSLLVSLVMFFWNKRQKEKDKDVDEKERKRVESEMLRISLLVASAQLSYAVAMAWKRGEPNGEIEVGIEQYNKAMDKFRIFEREQLVKG